MMVIRAVKIKMFSRISFMASVGFMLLDFLQALKAARWRLRLSLHTPLWTANQGLSSEALFPQLFMWHSPLTHLSG